MAEALGVGDHGDLDDPAARYREIEDDLRASLAGPHESRGSIHERELCGTSTPRECGGDGRRSADLLRCTHLHGFTVGPETMLGSSSTRSDSKSAPRAAARNAFTWLRRSSVKTNETQPV